MISSKRINVTAAVLIIIAVAFAVYTMLTPPAVTVANFTGEAVYGSGHKVVFTDDDYTGEFAGGSKIVLNGAEAASDSSNVQIDGSNITILGGGVYKISGSFEGSITVDSSDSAAVRLVLGNVSVVSPDFAALYIKQAEKVILEAEEGTQNHFADSTERLENSEISAAVYSKDDLTITGGGSISVTGNYEDGIKCNDTLKITQGTLSVTAADEGINANDCIAMRGASVTVTSGGHGIKCEHEDSDKGFIAFEGTNISLESQRDGVQASSAVYVNDAVMRITAADDAVHAEGDLILNPKSIDVQNCNEGLEGAYIEISGGDINIVSQDDAINVVGIKSAGGMPMPGRQKENITDEDIYLKINGGNIYLETGGDGVDSNGAAVINGGNVIVYGPENSANSSLDFEYGFIINGGSLIAAGSSGMAELPSDTSEQNSLVFYLDETCDAGSSIALHDSDRNEVISGTCSKKFDWVCVSTAGIEQGESYTLSINGAEKASLTAESAVSSQGGRGREGRR